MKKYLEDKALQSFLDCDYDEFLSYSNQIDLLSLLNEKLLYSWFFYIRDEVGDLDKYQFDDFYIYCLGTYTLTINDENIDRIVKTIPSNFFVIYPSVDIFISIENENSWDVFKKLCNIFNDKGGKIRELHLCEHPNPPLHFVNLDIEAINIDNRNCLPSIPNWIAEIKSLKEIYLSCRVSSKKLPNWLLNMDNLVKLGIYEDDVSVDDEVLIKLKDKGVEVEFYG